MKDDLSVIDVDIHPIINPERLLEFLAEPWRSRFATGSRGPGALGYWNPNGVRRRDTVLEDDTRIESDPKTLATHFFDAYQIEYGILNFGPYGVALSPELDWSAAVLSATNDVIMHDWLPVDPRFRAALEIPVLAPELAVREIHRCGDHPGFAHIMMPGGAQMPYGHRFYHPIYAAAVEHDLPIALHPGTEGIGVSGAPTAVGYPSGVLEWHTGLVATFIGQLISLVSEGVFKKFPTLKFVLIEEGVAWLPPVLWRFDKNWKALRATTPWVDRLPSEIVADHILLSTQPIEEPEDPKHFHAAMSMFDAANMLMFSSDYPHWDGDTPDFAARSFTPELRKQVLSETARRLYRLPARVAADGERRHVTAKGRGHSSADENGNKITSELRHG
jgi:predicted TIM-barrel fold metal-dependent hydrolase